MVETDFRDQRIFYKMIYICIICTYVYVSMRSSLIVRNWFSAFCAAAIAHGNDFFHLYQPNNLICLKLISDRLVIVATRFLKLPNLAMLKKQMILLWLRVPSKCKFAIPALFNDPKVLSSESDNARLFQFFSKTSNPILSRVSLYLLSFQELSWLRWPSSIVIPQRYLVLTDFQRYLWRVANLNFHTYYLIFFWRNLFFQVAWKSNLWSLYLRKSRRVLLLKPIVPLVF